MAKKTKTLAGDTTAPELRGMGPYFRASEEDSAPYGGILPDGADAWDQVLERPLRHAPWPYLEPEWELIHRLASCSEASELAIFAARQWIANRSLKTPETPAKPDVISELTEIARLVAELRGSISRCSVQAQQFLREHSRPLALPEDREPLMVVRHAVNRFDSETHVAIHLLHDPVFLGSHPELAMLGRPENLANEWLIYWIWRAWVHAHAGRAPKRGFPAFRESCLDPLVRFGLPALSAKAWQDALAKAKRRAVRKKERRKKSWK